MVTFLYVYFAKKLPQFVTHNIQRTVSLFPECELVLVTDATNVETVPDRVRIFRPHDLEWFHSRPALDQDPRFWGGWWQKTFDRLFFLRPIHELYPAGPLVQVETDVILFPSILSSGLLDSEAISFPLYSANQGVASIIYSPSTELTKKFELSLIRELKENQRTTDMLALGQVCRNLASDFRELREFPDLSQPMAGYKPSVNLTGFDGTSHGEWICGRDPKAHWGFGKRLQRTPASEPVEMGRYFSLGNQLFLSLESGTIPIHNLHIHSKEIDFFLPWPNSQVEKTLMKINNNSSALAIRYFKVSAFFFCLLSRIRIWSSSSISVDAWRRLFRHFLDRGLD